MNKKEQTRFDSRFMTFEEFVELMNSNIGIKKMAKKQLYPGKESKKDPNVEYTDLTVANQTNIAD